jgi:hypothetical protein
MNASANIITAVDNNCLMLSTRAIKKDAQGNSYVQIMNGGEIKTQAVVIGPNDGTNTEIISGLREGDKVITSGAAGKWSLGK